MSWKGTVKIRMLNIKNEGFMGIYNFAELFHEKLKMYTEQWEIAEQNIRSVVREFSEKMKPVRAFYILGEHQFTYWKPLCFDEIEEIVNVSDVNKYLEKKMEDKSFIDYDILCDEMIQSGLLSDTNKAILKQSIQAMSIGLYDLTLIGIVAVFDGVLSIVTNDDTPKIPRRINQIKDKLEDLSEEEWELLEEADITAFGIYITWMESMKGFQKHSEFSQPETEPKDLNRHWIAHGRKTTIATKLDCCKLINALYGLIYLGTSIQE